MALRHVLSQKCLAKLLCKFGIAPAPFTRGFCVFSQSTAVAQTTQQTASAWRSWAATSAAIAGLAYMIHESNGAAQCLTPPRKQDEVTVDAPTEQLLRWLPAVGAEVDAIDVKTSQSTPAAGYGVFASNGLKQLMHVSWWKQPWYRMRKPNDGIVLASFPLQAAITPQTILSDPVLGSTYQELLNIGVVDERTLTLLFLTVERQLGIDSVWHPWLNMLQKNPPVPLFYSGEEMAELRGTSLEEAVGVQRWHLAQQWKRLEPACKDLLRKSGAADKQPTLEDFMWAHAVFWSRSLSFPQPSAQAGQLVTTPQEGIVPGLDFCNHRTDSIAKWTIFGTPGLQVAASGEAAVIPTQMALVCPRQQAPRIGDEITIDYGDKSNEQLLMSYGFAQPNNINDVLMVKCPIAPPEDRDESLEARLQLLRSRGLQPQLFLPAKLLELRPTRSAKDRHKLWLPEDVEETLKILVMVPKQLEAELISETQPEPAENTLDKVEESGERLAVLTTLEGLLRLKHLQMEGEDGTGALESDSTIMDAEGESMSETKRACLLYRASQKRIAREYLIRARHELDTELDRLRKLQQQE